MEIIAILIITALVAFYIVLPFFFRSKNYIEETLPGSGSVDEPTTVDRLTSLSNQKETLYAAIRDIDFDYGLGKLSKDDYEELNSKYKNEAASVLKEIDECQKLQEQSGGRTLDQELEQEILSYRKSKPVDDDDIENEISAFRAGTAGSAKNMCPQCGSGYSAEDLFCSKCGVKLK